jgi:hypothetical protein
MREACGDGRSRRWRKANYGGIPQIPQLSLLFAVRYLGESPKSRVSPEVAGDSQGVVAPRRGCAQKNHQEKESGIQSKIRMRRRSFRMRVIQRAWTAAAIQGAGPMGRRRWTATVCVLVNFRMPPAP